MITRCTIPADETQLLLLPRVDRIWAWLNGGPSTPAARRRCRRRRAISIDRWLSVVTGHRWCCLLFQRVIAEFARRKPEKAPATNVSALANAQLCTHCKGATTVKREQNNNYSSEKNLLKTNLIFLPFCGYIQKLYILMFASPKCEWSSSV